MTLYNLERCSIGRVSRLEFFFYYDKTISSYLPYFGFVAFVELLKQFSDCLLASQPLLHMISSGSLVLLTFSFVQGTVNSVALASIHIL